MKFTFSDCWEGIEVQYWREAELEFVPFVGMQFNFELEAFELFVGTVIWHHNEGILAVGFDSPQHDSKEAFVEAVRTTIAEGQWEHLVNEAGLNGVVCDGEANQPTG